MGHGAHTVTALPGAENLLDASAYPLDWPVDPPQLLFCRCLVARPHTQLHHPGNPASVFHRLSETRPTIGAVGIDLARLVWHHIAPGIAIIDIGRRDPNPFDKIGGLIGCHMGLVAMHRFFALVLDEPGFLVLQSWRMQ